MQPTSVLRAVLLAGACLGAAAPSTLAAGPVSLFNVPARVMEDSLGAGNHKVSFGWSQGTLAGGVPLWYILSAHPLAGGADISTTVGFDGIPPYSGSLILTEGVKYRISVTTWALVTLAPGVTVPQPVGFSNTFDTTPDYTGPSYPDITINGNASFTNRLTVNVRVDSPDVFSTQGQLVIDGPSFPGNAGFPCTNVELTCPFNLPLFTLAGGSHWFTTVQRDLPASDGLHTIWGQVRDNAAHPTTNPVGSFGTVVQGNSSYPFSNYSTITVDTTPPVAKVVADKVNGVAGTPVTVDATPSTDATSGVKAAGFVWKWGDGSADQTGTSQLAHTYPGPGTYKGTVVVHDNAGNATDPNDTNFSSTTFTVTITAKPVATPTPAPTPTPTPTPAAGAGGLDLTGKTPSGGAGGAAASKPDIPLDESQATKGKKDQTVAIKGGIARSTTGPIATAKVGGGGNIKPGTEFPVKVDMRSTAKVTAEVVNAKGKVVDRETSKERKGKQELELQAPTKPGNYKVIVDTAGGKKAPNAPTTPTPTPGPNPEQQLQQQLTVAFKVLSHQRSN